MEIQHDLTRLVLKSLQPKNIGFILVPISNTQVGSKGLAISNNFLLGGGLQLETPTTCHMVSRKYLHSHGQRLNWSALIMEFNSQLIDGYQWLFNLKIKKTTSPLLSKDGNCHFITRFNHWLSFPSRLWGCQCPHTSSVCSSSRPSKRSSPHS